MKVSKATPVASPVVSASEAAYSKPAPPASKGVLEADRFEVSNGHGDPAAINQANAVTGQRAARNNARNPIQWGEPMATLNELSQIDNLRTTTGDPNRCGAAAITAGMILRGADASNAGVQRLTHRATELRAEVSAMQPPADPVHLQRLDTALRTLSTLDQRNAHQWTNADGSRFQEALYLVARTDQAVHAGFAQAHLTPSGLAQETVHSYRDLVWGATRGSDGRFHVNTPQYVRADGQAVGVDVAYRGDGHFVLAEGMADPVSGGHRILYDSWPRSDGTAYSQAVDGGDERYQVASLSAGLNPRLGTARRFGFDVDLYPRLNQLSGDERANFVERMRRDARD
jgi:hypothetical protein